MILDSPTPLALFLLVLIPALSKADHADIFPDSGNYALHMSPPIVVGHLTVIRYGWWEIIPIIARWQIVSWQIESFGRRFTDIWYYIFIVALVEFTSKRRSKVRVMKPNTVDSLSTWQRNKDMYTVFLKFLPLFCTTWITSASSSLTVLNYFSKSKILWVYVANKIWASGPIYPLRHPRGNRHH